jgi:hypothetical protein
MSGSKTRPGFFSGGEPPATKPDEEPSPRAARTVIGHEIHLRTPLVPSPETEAPPPPRPTTSGGVPEPITDETTEELPPRPSHSGKSKFPALARLFGRWTTGGGFLSRSHMSDGADDLPRVPRDAWVSRVAIFAMAALLSFLVALAVLKVHKCGEPGSSPSGKTRVSMSPAPPAPPAASARPAALPASSAPPASLAAASHTPVATASAAPLAQAPAVHPNATHQPTTGAGSSAVRTVPHATRKLRARRTQLDPPMSSTKNADALLPLRM